MIPTHSLGYFFSFSIMIVIAKIFQGLYDSGLTTLQSETVEIGAAGGDVTYSISFYKFFLADGKVAQDGK